MAKFEENEISAKSNGGTEITKRSVAALIPDELAAEFQVIASRVREILNDKIRIYWQHDLAEDPEVNHLRSANSRDRFHKFIFSSNWQLQEYVTKLGFPQDERTQVIETPVESLPFVEKDVSGQINLIYFSTPQRGLGLLIPVFDALYKKYPNVHCHVFSSFKIYGWDEADAQFEPLYEQIRQHPGMTYHGFASAEVLREHLLKAHVLAYPCVWKETSCRVLIESMSAGLMCVHPNLAALPDTSGGLTSMYQFMDDPNKHANVFFHYLDHAVQAVQMPEVQAYLGFVKRYADHRFNLQKIASYWNSTMTDLLQRYATVESRALPSADQFEYRT